MAKRRAAKPRQGRVFLLPPANCSGRRAKIVLSERAQFDLALRLRSDRGGAIGEGFALVSGPDFKGKLAYAPTFARPPQPGGALPGSGAAGIPPEPRLPSGG